ncbi:MAG: UvrD-helicase domain-containing protein, partial [Sandaracinus sp.]|nr:UvrD-helicase domain-containing protein [Sandaracinus sp.]
MKTLRFARPALLDALPERGHAVIEASAGTGKTYTLEHLVVELLVRGAPLDQILVVTFTEKATREMRARVRATLGAIVTPRADDPRVNPTEGSFWTFDDAARARVTEAFVGFERAPISTIHGFCQRVLSEQAFLSRRPFRSTLVEPRRAFGRAFREELRVVLADASPLRAVVLRVLASMDAETLESGLFPWHVERGAIRPRWDREAFADALDRMPRRSDLAPYEAVVRTAYPRAEVAARVMESVVALAALVDESRSRRDADEDAALLDALVALDAWARVEVVRGEPRRAWLPARLAQASTADPRLAELLGRLDALLDVATSPFGVLVQELLPRVRDRLRATKAREGTMDFDDMLGLVAEALEGPSGEALVRSLRAQYSHALVDEFQDTDELQWSIFRRLFVEGTDRHSLYVIGDPKQAIYGFRNADVHTYRAACARLSGGRPPSRLVDCYRSTPRVIAAYNEVFADDFFRGPIRYDEPVRAGDPTRAARDSSGKDLAAMTLWTVVGEEKPTADDVRATLGGAIARECRRLVEEEPVELVERGGRRRLGYSDVFVLTRTAKEAESIANALEREGVPYAFYKREGLFRTVEAREVLDLLDAVADPTDASARLRAWLTPFYDVPLASLHACRKLDPQHPLVASLYRFRELAERHDGAGLLRAMLEDTGLARRLLFRSGGEAALTTYQHVLEVLLEDSGGRRGADDLAARLRAFVEGRAEPLSGEGSVQRLASDRPAVQLLTMHKSKGLEASVVFLAGGFTRGGGGGETEPLVAHREGKREAWVRPVPREVEARVEEEARAEDERLLYVALTRAKARLYVPYFGAPPEGARGIVGCHERFGPVQGAHRWLDERLAALVARGFVDGDAVTFEALAVHPPEKEKRGSTTVPWELADALVEEAVPARDFDGLRRRHAGFVVTSYSRMAKQAATTTTVAYDEEDEQLLEEIAAEATWTPESGEALVSPDPEDVAFTLPGGAAMGVFLHAALETLYLPGVDVAATLEDPARVTSIVEAAARRSLVDEALAPASAELITRALRVPLALPGLALPGGLATLSGQRVPEMSFAFPIPETAHPALVAAASEVAEDVAAERDLVDSSEGIGGHVDDARPFRIRRGVLRGVIDLVLTHEGRTFFLDWKSDRLPDFAAVPLQAHVDQHYALQARLYTLGILRLLGVRDEAAYERSFGGLLYAFLRGMNPAAGLGAGVT